MTEGHVTSLGTTQSNFLFNTDHIELEIDFAVVGDNFPISVDGIIGKDFIKVNSCTLDYSSMNFIIRHDDKLIEIPIINDNDNDNYHTIPPRCEVVQSFRLIADSTDDQVVDNLEIFPGVLIARCIVNPQKCFLRILNTNNKPVEVKKILKLQSQNLNNFNVLSIKNSITNREDILLKTLSPNIPNHAPQALTELCTDYSDIFALPEDKYTTNNFYTQKLNLNDSSPVYVKNYRYPFSQKDEISKQINNMIENNVIEPSISSYNSPIILVPKKSLNGEKKYRLCIDFRQLNKKLIPDKFPLPRIDEILDNLGRTIYFSKLDLFSGFWQVPLDEESKHLTSFSTGQGSYQFNVLPFGLNVAPNSFARMMALAFSGLDVTTAFIYLDDVIVVGASESHHLENLRKVFNTCRDKNLKLNPLKCEFMKSEIIFLGHKCTSKGIFPDSSKFNTILNYPIPSNADAVKRYIAFANYYRRFIPRFGIVASPLNALTGKKSKFIWTEECQKSFDYLKNALINPPILQYPNFSKQFILTVDASKQGIGAVLSQLTDDGDDLPIAYASSGFSQADRNKAPIYQELLAIYFGIKHFRPYLFGTKFLVRSDHKPLSFLFSMKDPTSKFARIRTELTAYDFIIEYLPGQRNVAADALSRLDFKDIRDIQTTNKQILAITRSMTKPTDKPNNTCPYPIISSETNNNIPNNKAIRKDNKTNIAISNASIRKLPFVKFIINKIDQSTELCFSIRGRHLAKSHLLSFNPRNVDLSLRLIFTELDNICSKKGYSNVRISDDDTIFNMMRKEDFIRMSNETLKNVTIWIMQPITAIESITEQQQIIKHFHEHELDGGHAGQKRLYMKLRSKFYWKNMAKHIAIYIKNCQQCRINKPKVKNKEPLVITETPKTPFYSISIDTIGPFETTTNQVKYALTIICEFSKYVIIVPIPNKESKTIAKALLNSCILTFGRVIRIRSDLGTEFVNRIVTNLTELLRIRHDRSTAYHHESLGTIERSHKTLNEYLRTYMTDHKDWPKLVKYFEYCYNTTPNTSIDMYTPFELVFGRIPLSLAYKDISTQIESNISDYVQNIKNNLDIAYKRTQQFLHNNKIKTKTYYDKNINPINIKVNDKVMLVNEIRNKFDRLYKDEYIVKDIQDSNVLIEHIISKKSILVHKNRIRKQ